MAVNLRKFLKVLGIFLLIFILFIIILIESSYAIRYYSYKTQKVYKLPTCEVVDNKNNLKLKIVEINKEDFKEVDGYFYEKVLIVIIILS